jgi:hypothetical protein
MFKGEWGDELVFALLEDEWLTRSEIKKAEQAAPIS